MKIYTLIPKLRAAVGAVGKDSRNAALKYNFRSVDDIFNAVAPHLTELGITTEVRTESLQATSETQVIENSQGKTARSVYHVCCIVKVRLIAEDGSAVEWSVPAEGVDYNGDKAAAKALSMGVKYAYSHGLLIPFENVPDSDRDEPAAQPETPARPPVPAGQSVNPTLPGSIQQHQIDDILHLVQRAGWPKERLRDVLAKKGFARLGELSHNDASGLLAVLRQAALQQEAKEAF